MRINYAAIFAYDASRSCKMAMRKSKPALLEDRVNIGQGKKDKSRSSAMHFEYQ
jgi:hypothetical protein